MDANNLKQTCQPLIGAANEYIRSLSIQLGESINDKKKIYIDLRYWIFLRDVTLKKADKHLHILILNKLRELVRRGKVVCPPSESVLYEIMRQKCTSSRLATTHLVDELSQNTCLVLFTERINIELLHFACSALRPNDYHDLLDTLVWTKPFLIFGHDPEELILNNGITNKTQLKSYITSEWNRSLTDMAQRLLPVQHTFFNIFKMTAESINSGNASHAGDVTSFKNLINDEFIGLLSVHGDALASAMIDFGKLFTPNLIPNTSPTPEEKEGLSNLLANKILIDGDLPLIPTMYILAACHAAIRWNVGHQISPNDLQDFHHATGAVAYCDAFFTDRPLQALLTQGHLALDKKFQCKIISDENEALDYLETIK